MVVGIKQAKVKGYTKQDGTAVRSHLRRFHIGRKNHNTKPPKPGSLIDLNPTDINPVAGTISVKMYRDIVDATHRKIHGVNNVFEKIFSQRNIFAWAGGTSAITIGRFLTETGGSLALTLAANLFIAVPFFAYWAGRPLRNMWSTRLARKAVKKLSQQTPLPTSEQLDHLRKNFEPADIPDPPQKLSLNDKIENFFTNTRIPLSKYYGDGTATIEVDYYIFEEQNDKDLKEVRKMFPVGRICNVHPGVDLSGEDFSHGHFQASNVDVRGANFSGTKFYMGSFASSLLDGVNMENCSMDIFDLSGTSFRGANLKNVNMDHTNTQDADFTDADLEGAILSDLRKSAITISKEQMLSLDPKTFTSCHYDKISLEDAMKELGVSEKQFEFLIMSQAIPVRAAGGVIVTSGFHPEEHHVAPWDIYRAEKMLAAQNVSAPDPQIR